MHSDKPRRLGMSKTPEVLTITLNPALDYSSSTKRVIAGPKLYCKEPRVEPGGGGVNVARTIHRLRGKVKALVAIGGASGNRLLQLLENEQVPVQPILVEGETRQSFAITDESDGTQYRFSFPGDVLGAETGNRLIAEIISQKPSGGLVVLSGGVAPGLGDAFPERIRSALAPYTDKLIVDTSKTALAHLIEHPVSPVYILRLDHREAERAAGYPLVTQDANLEFACSLIRRGVARVIVLGLGAEGSLLVSEDARYLCRAPQVPVVSKVGAGDAFVGALSLLLARGAAYAEALQWGVAAACATMGTPGTDLCDLRTVNSLLPHCKVQKL